MAQASDILVIGGGIAGLSGAAEMAANAKVTLLEAEDHSGFHASGRSATMFHYALGNALIRRLTQASRETFDQPPAAFGETPLGKRMTLLLHVREDELADLDQARMDMAPFAALDELDEAGLTRLCPLLRVGEGGSVRGLADHDALRIDQHALMQGYAKLLRGCGGRIVTGAKAERIVREDGVWRVTDSRGGRHEVAIVVNAAGAWADEVAIAAGVSPLGLRPLKRTIITFDAPAGTDLDALPFTKTVGDELYFAAESGRLFASPMDEEPSEPCDAQPDEIGIATAAYRMEERSVVRVSHIHSRWSGLRTFAPDRRPAVGFAPDADGFFWLAGQGGAGLQTAPALAKVAAALVVRSELPVPGIDASELDPGRFLGKSGQIDPALADELE